MTKRTVLSMSPLLAPSLTHQLTCMPPGITAALELMSIAARSERPAVALTTDGPANPPPPTPPTPPVAPCGGMGGPAS